jgi:prephenate dehydrogenase
MAQVTVAIIGLQRLGASFGMAIRRLNDSPGIKHQFIVLGSDKNQDTLKTARSLGAIDQELRDLESVVQKADVVFVASPYSLVEDIFSVIGSALKPGAVVIDASPLKQPSISWAKKHFRRNADGQPEAYLVGVTPVINPEHLTNTREDLESATADLFDNGLMIISPATDCPEEAVQLVVELADLMHLKVHFSDPVEHDGMIAAMEGLPLLLQLGLFRTLSKSRSWGDLQRLSNSAFSLATYRLAQSKPQDLGATVDRNRANLVHNLDTLIEELSEMRALLNSQDEISTEQIFADAMDRYERWQFARQDNTWDEKTAETPSLRPSGIMGNVGSVFSPFSFKNKRKNDDRK